MFNQKKFIILTVLFLIVFVLILSLNLRHIFVNAESKIVRELKNIDKFIAGEYYVQSIVDPEGFGMLSDEFKLLVRIEGKANISIDLSKITSKDVEIDENSKTVLVKIPVPEFSDLSLKKPEIVYEKATYYKSDAEIDEFLEKAKVNTEAKLKSIIISSEDIASFEKFLRLFLKKIVGEEYDVKVVINR